MAACLQRSSQRPARLWCAHGLTQAGMLRQHTHAGEEGSGAPF